MRRNFHGPGQICHSHSLKVELFFSGLMSITIRPAQFRLNAQGVALVLEASQPINWANISIECNNQHVPLEGSTRHITVHLGEISAVLYIYSTVYVIELHSTRTERIQKTAVNAYYVDVPLVRSQLLSNKKVMNHKKAAQVLLVLAQGC